VSYFAAVYPNLVQKAVLISPGGIELLRLDEEADGMFNTNATRIPRGMFCDAQHIPVEEGAAASTLTAGATGMATSKAGA
jgi:hypothetical protein